MKSNLFFRWPSYPGMVMLNALGLLMLATIISLIPVFAFSLLLDSSPNNVLIGRTLLCIGLPMMLVILVLVFKDLRYWLYKEK